MGASDEAEESEPFWPEIVCFGDIGNDKAFYIHSDTWYGGDTSVFKMSHLYYGMKLGFKEAYFRTGGKPPAWGISLPELLEEHAP